MQHTPVINVRRNSGMTIIELLIMLFVTSLIAGTLLVSLSAITLQARANGLRAAYQQSVGLAADRLEHDIRLSNSFVATVDARFADPYAPSGGWSYTGVDVNSRVLLITVPSTSDRGGVTSRQPTYTDSNEFDCSPSQLTYNPVQTYQAIYFVSNRTLYKRFLTDTTTPLCIAQIQKQSCPSAAIASWPAICKARDEIIATDISQFSVTYYSSSATKSISNQYSDPSTLVNAQGAVITLTAGDNTPSNSVSASITVRATKVN